MIIEQRLKKNRPYSFFDFDFHGTSGIKTLIGDLKNSSKNTQNSAVQKQSSIIELLDKQVNTEKYLDADLAISIPFGQYHYNSTKIIPAFIAGVDFAGLFSVSNAGDATNPILQSYLRFDQTLGGFVELEFDDQTMAQMKFYQLARKDKYSLFNASALVNDGNVIGGSKLDQVDTFMMVDALYAKFFKDQLIQFELQQLQIVSNVFDGKEYYYPNFPFWNIHYEFYYKSRSNHVTFFTGLHNRERYSLMKGFYTGLKIKNILGPIHFLGIVDANFISIIPRLTLPFFNLSYTIKLPIYNPQQDYWVGVIHGLNLSFIY